MAVGTTGLFEVVLFLSFSTLAGEAEGMRDCREEMDSQETESRDERCEVREEALEGRFVITRLELCSLEESSDSIRFAFLIFL